MEIMTLHRKLLLNCTSSTSCIDPYTYYCCVYASSPSSSSPVADQSQPSPQHGPNHAIPYVVSAACLLGVLSLILTTCTILLRHRFSRSRTSSSPPRDPHSSSVSQDRSPVDHPIWHIVTVGLPQSIIDSIASVKYKSSGGLIEESDCSVCLTGFEDGDDLRLLPKCNHAFHLPCIDTWLRSHKNCPLCRSSVVSDYPPPPPVNVNLSDSSPNSTSPSPSETALVDNPGSLDDHDIDSWHVQGAEVWKSDPEKGVLMDDFEAVRGSISLDNVVGKQTGEGSSQQEKGTDGEEADKEGHGISRLIKSSSSIGRSSAKILSSFRGGKSQSSSTLPHL